MNADETARIMSMFTAAHPKVQLTPQTVQVWHEAALGHCDFELGARIAIELISKPSDRGDFPTPAQFNEAKRRTLQRDQMRRNPLSAEPDADETEPGQLPSREAREWFEEMRAKLGRTSDDRSTT